MPDGGFSGSRWSVYLLRCADGSLYTGIALDVARRMAEHERGVRGAKYLRGRGPFRLELERVVGGRGAALRLERDIKRLSKAAKEALLANPDRLDSLLTPKP